MKLTKSLEPAQERAAHTLDRHVSVIAGPGSGKTTVLVERYLHILREKKPSSIDQIVAITFTNRAANEMRERLRKALDGLLITSDGVEHERWRRYKRTLDGAVITTIHGLCMRLLREFPVEAGLDPQFMLLDEHRAATLLAAAVEESLTESISRRDESVARLTAGIGRPMLATALFEMYLKIRGHGLSFDDVLKRTIDSHSAAQDYNALCDELDARMAELISLRGLTSRGNEKRAAVQRYWPRVREILRASETPLADYCGAIVEFREASRPDARGHIATLVKQLDELFWGESKEKCFGRLPQMRFDLLAKDYSAALVKLLKSIDRRFTEKKQELSALDFDDLQLRAFELLQRPEVLTRASQRYRYFLVDEFQDTNGLQRDLLHVLTLNRGARANLFIVGDRKQSIYGFRGADVDVFGNMTEALRTAGGEVVSLPLNFRSQPPLINFFNYLFARFFRPSEEVTKADLSELGFVEHEPSVGKREVRDAPPLVELMIDRLAGDDDPRSKQTPRERDAKQLVQRIISLTETPLLTGSAFTGSADLFTGSAFTGSADLFTGSAGVSPASRRVSTHDGENLDASTSVASRVEGGRDAGVAAGVEGGRDARAPSKEVDAPSEGVEGNGEEFEYRDIALLFRAMTDVPVYEAEFRRAGIPFQTVLGKGFYEREEITDLIQLCRFLDNRTDELALAAVLRSPLCGISDNTLLALRLGPKVGETTPGESPQPRKHPRPLFQALRRQREIDFITEDERAALERAVKLLSSLTERRNRYSIGELLRFAIEQSAYTTVIAATFDGAQRLANVDKLFNLAEQFERSGAHLIRDFVKYVHDFETIGSRESEGQLDDSANAVKLMTVHQAKGLEFPVVIIPDLHRSKASWDGYFLLDRHRGLTLKVPDGRGQMVSGRTFAVFNERSRLREDFESMRLLYVAATRARDRLVLSGATKDSSKLAKGNDSWLQLIWQSLEFGARSAGGLVGLDPDTQLQLTFDLVNEESAAVRSQSSTMPAPALNLNQDLPQIFPLIAPVEAERHASVHRFSVTQLINFQRCPRQYYFDRVLHVPSADEMAVWMTAEAPEPPANLTATLKGAVIHRFCETYVVGDDERERLAQSLDDVIRARQAQLADRLPDINADEALKELWPLAQNYLSSKLFVRIEQARREALNGSNILGNSPGLWSEVSFRLRRPLGILTGTIDKLIITPSPVDEGFDVEVVDFKTNRFAQKHSSLEQSSTSSLGARTSRPQTDATTSSLGAQASRPHIDATTSSLGARASRPQTDAPSLADAARDRPSFGTHYQTTSAQMAFDFTTSTAQLAPKPAKPETQISIEEQVRLAATDYQLQMQAYALAVRELMPELLIRKVRTTLHFLQPDVEVQLSEGLLQREECAQALDGAMLEIISSNEPHEFPVQPAVHCRICNFLSICPAGRQWLASQS